MYMARKKCFQARQIDGRLLKRGQRYSSVTFGNLVFKNLMLFTCPMSLDTYLKTWSDKNEITDNFKLAFP